MRYEIREDSQSGHCCFQFTVVDTSRPHQFNDGQFEAMCETFELPEANKICEALNEHDEAPLEPPSLLSEPDKDAIKHWMYESLDGNGILEDGGLTCIEDALTTERDKRRDAVDEAMNAVYQYAHGVLFGFKEG